MSELYLIVRIGNQRVAMRAAEVESVVEIEEVTPVPRAPAFVRGVAALRSRVLTVIDSRLALGLSPASDEEGINAIIVQMDGHAYAVTADAVEDALEIEGEPEPLRTTPEAGWSRVAIGTLECNGMLLLVVDIRAIIAAPADQAAA